MQVQRYSPERLRQARMAGGLRREALALQIGRSAPTIVQYETSREHMPPVVVLERLSDVLGCTVADFFEDGDR
jgi:transcriptional regulator with XRE-family HTH domain